MVDKLQSGFTLLIISYKNRKYLSTSSISSSSYSKLILNAQQSLLLINRLKKNVPKKGLIQVLTITEKQYAKMEYILGENNSKIINSEDRLVVL